MREPNLVRVDAFLAWEARQSIPHELIDGLIVAMSNPTRAHGRLVRRLNRAIDAACGDACDVYLGDMTVRIAGSERDNAPRPDIVVTYDDRDRHPRDEFDRTICYPKLIAEVLSPRTAAQDLGTKLRSDFSIATMEEYLVVDSRKRSVILHRRVHGSVVTTWPEDVVRLESLHCHVEIDALYAR